MVLNFLQIVKPSEQIHRFPRAHHTVEWQADTLKCCYLGQRHILAQRAWQRPFEYHAEWRILMDYNVFHEYEKHPHSNWSQICKFIPPAGFWVVFSGRTIFPVRSRWGRYILPTQYIYIYFILLLPIYTLLNRQKPMEYGYESKPHPSSTQIVHSWHLWMFIPPVI